MSPAGLKNLVLRRPELTLLLAVFITTPGFSFGFIFARSDSHADSPNAK
jgi:hypothetical protein